MEMISVISSAISAIGYNKEAQQMRITFKQGHTYSFCRVPENVFLGLLNAGSKGRYYDDYIKDRYQC